MAKVPILRVNQMNAIYFDNEIQKLFLEHMQVCWKHLQPQYTTMFGNELNLLVKCTILWYSIWKCNSTFGQKLLCMSYDNITNIKKCFLSIGLFLEYLMEKSQNSTDNKFLYINMALLRNIFYFFRFVNISIFLRNGLKPRLMERILCLNLSYNTSKTVQRQYDSQYTTRELIWDSFIEILVYILPLINYHKIKRSVRHLNPFYKKLLVANTRAPQLTANMKCPHCNEFPILPHHMNCMHVFCYTCLKGNQMADTKYECPICHYYSENNVCEKVT